jgi:hypothetical protein
VPAPLLQKQREEGSLGMEMGFTNDTAKQEDQMMIPAASMPYKRTDFDLFG